jgi:hypothetical protein
MLSWSVPKKGNENMLKLEVLPTPKAEDVQGREAAPDMRDHPLKLKIGAQPLDLMPTCRFDEVRDDVLLFDLCASVPADAIISPIRRGEDHRTVLARPFFIPRNMTTDAVKDAIRSRVARSASPLEFLAFASQHPDAMLKVPIVTLGWSRPDGRWMKYAMLTTDARHRRILRSVSPPSWPKDWRYLIIIS